ncbi:hypothetical protein PVAP13_1KG195905 [Panicum virgatum]|uniref:Uncharacterized protein n=1 Tax=Panicum virgatum TaxID=38727 RepID=A0A8T0X835_PANVG|nr:hypothetical protein PVAP13_1KG195905 [Panicum virgatum]
MALLATPRAPVPARHTAAVGARGGRGRERAPPPPPAAAPPCRCSLAAREPGACGPCSPPSLLAPGHRSRSRVRRPLAPRGGAWIRREQSPRAPWPLGPLATAARGARRGSAALVHGRRQCSPMVAAARAGVMGPGAEGGERCGGGADEDGRGGTPRRRIPSPARAPGPAGARYGAAAAWRVAEDGEGIRPPPWACHASSGQQRAQGKGRAGEGGVGRPASRARWLPLAVPRARHFSPPLHEPGTTIPRPRAPSCRVASSARPPPQLARSARCSPPPWPLRRARESAAAGVRLREALVPLREAICRLGRVFVRLGLGLSDVYVV